MVPSKPIAGIFFQDQAIALKSQGCKVGIIYVDMAALSLFRGACIVNKLTRVNCEDEKGVPTFRAEAYKFPYFHKLNLIRWHRYTSILYDKYVEHYGVPDIIHAHSAIGGGSAAAMIKAQHGVPYVLTEHSSMFEKKLIQPWQKPYIDSAFTQASRVNAVSGPFKNILGKMYPHQEIGVIPNLVDTEYFHYPPCNYTQNNKFRFISIGFLKENKGFMRLIKSFSTAFDDEMDIELLIGGDGEQRQILMDYVKELNIEGQVTFLGELSREQVRKALWDSDVFVLTSDNETFGVVLIEAMSTGMPVIATRCGGPEGFVSKDVGWLVNKDNIKQIACTMKEAYNKYKSTTSRSEYIRQYIINKFSSPVIGKSLMSQYHEVLSSESKC